MLSIGLMSIRSWEYYANYLALGGEPPGRWWGEGAARLGLTGIVAREDLKSLFQGYRPGSDQGLVQNAGDPKRRAGFDFTFNAPKSVSIAAVLENTRNELLRIQKEAVEYGLQRLQDTCAFSRVGSVSKGEWGVTRADLVVATFRHSASRENDPHLHHHCLILNVGLDSDGKTRTLFSTPMFESKLLLGAFYRAKLAQLLRDRLHLACEREGDSFRLWRVPQLLVDKKSTRRKQVVALMKKRGETGGAAASKATLATRRTKDKSQSIENLLKVWQRDCKAHGFGPKALKRLQRAKSRDPQKDLPRILARAMKNLGRKFNHFAEPNMLLEVLYEAPNVGLAPELIPDAVTNFLQTNSGIVRLREVSGQRRYTTEAVLKSERRLIETIEKLQKRRGPRAQPMLVAKMLAKEPSTTEEQIRAINHLTQSQGSIRLLDGLPGTGKTRFVLKTCCEIWRKQGFRVVGATPTGKAACELEEGAGIPADTIHMHLADFDRSWGFVAKHHLKQLARAARHKPTYRLKHPKPLKVDKKTIVLVDEAGMVDTRHWRKLTRLVERGGGMLVAIGDRHQLPPIEPGAPFQSLCERVGFASLEDIRRQNEMWARDAVKLFREGRTGEALKLYADRGLLTVRDDMDEALEALVQDWAKTGLTSPEEAIVLSSTNEESQAANELCQQRRIDAGCINPNLSAQIRDEDKSCSRAYRNQVHVGDRVLFTKNDRRLNVRNGFVGTVTAIGPFSRSIAVRLDVGRSVLVPLAKYQHLRLGYAMTTYKAQGATFRDTFVLAGGSMQDRPSSYVQASRARSNTRFYTTSSLVDESLESIKESQLASQMARTPNLSLAIDLLEEAPATDETPQRKEHENKQNVVDRQLPAFSPVVPQRRKQIQQRWKLRQRVRSRTAADRKRYAMAQEELRRRPFEKAIRMLLPASSPVLHRRRKQRQQPRKLGQRVRTVTPADRQRYAVANNELSRRTLKMATEFLQTGIADLPGS